MRNAVRLIGVCVSGVLLSGGAALAQDWPQWRGPNRDAKASGFAAPAQWPAQLRQVWKVTVGAGDSTPALVGKVLYTFGRQGDSELVMCLNAADGAERWKRSWPAAAIQGPAARQHSGPRSSPAVAGGKVVVIGVNGDIHCLSAATGEEAWKNDEYKSVPSFFTSCSAMIVDGMAVVQVGGQGNGGVVALDLATGAAKWKWADEAAMYSSPVAMTVDGTTQVVALTEKSLVGLALADGALLWQTPFAPAGRMSYNAATPIVDGRTVVVTGSGRGTKAFEIAKRGDGFAAKELWSNAEVCVQFNTPVLKDGLLFGLSDKGNLFCVDARDGRTAWVDAAAHGRGFAAIVDAGGVLVALPSTSELVVFKPDAKAYAEVAKVKVSDTQTYAYPVLAGDRIIVRDQDAVAVFALK